MDRPRLSAKNGARAGVLSRDAQDLPNGNRTGPTLPTFPVTRPSAMASAPSGATRGDEVAAAHDSAAERLTNGKE